MKVETRHHNLHNNHVNFAFIELRNWDRVAFGGSTWRKFNKNNRQVLWKNSNNFNNQKSSPADFAAMLPHSILGASRYKCLENNPENLFYFSPQSGKLTKRVRQQSQKDSPIVAAFANLRKNRLLWSQLWLLQRDKIIRSEVLAIWLIQSLSRRAN